MRNCLTLSGILSNSFFVAVGAILVLPTVGNAGLKDGKHSIRSGETALVYGAPNGCEDQPPAKSAALSGVNISPNIGKLSVGNFKGGKRLIARCGKKVPVLPVSYTAPKTDSKQTVTIQFPGEKAIVVTIEP